MELAPVKLQSKADQYVIKWLNEHGFSVERNKLRAQLNTRKETMIKTNAIQMSYDEYATLIEKITNGEAELHNDGYDWYYVAKDCYYEEANVKEKLQTELNAMVDSVIIDLSNKENGVVIIIK